MAAYAGIGARVTPVPVLELMEQAGYVLAQRGYTLRTGGAGGADRAFFQGANRQGAAIELFLPWPGFWTPSAPGPNVRIFTAPTPAAFEVAAGHTRGWANKNRGPRKLFARNAHIILGLNLDDPVEFVLCWTEGGRGEGGTGQALGIARANRIRYIDLGRGGRRVQIEEILPERREA